MILRHHHHRGRAVPGDELRNEDTRFDRGIESDQLLGLFDRRDIEDVEAALRLVVLAEGPRDSELSLLGQTLEDVRLHPPLIGPQPCPELRIVRAPAPSRESQHQQSEE